MECVSNIWTIVAFGEAINKFDIDVSIESLEEMIEWLGCQNIKDTDILMIRMNMIDDLDYMDKALYQLYKVLEDTLMEVYMRELLEMIAKKMMESTILSEEDYIEFTEEDEIIYREDE